LNLKITIFFLILGYWWQLHVMKGFKCHFVFDRILMTAWVHND